MLKDNPFLGTAYSARSPTLAMQQCINLFLEVVESKTGAEPAAFYGTPGLDLKAVAGSGPIRGMVAQGNNLYVVSGSGVYVVSSNFNVNLIGNLVSGSGNVSLISNTTQVAVFDGTNGYLIQNGALSTISLPFLNPVSAVLQDGFGLVSQAGTTNIWQSNYGDLSTWQALNYGVEGGNGGNIVALGELHRQVYVFKERQSYVWVNAGNNGFAFQRLDGVSMEVGTIASNSVVRLGEHLLFLSQSGEGQGIVYMISGYEPQRVSTHAIEFQIGKYPTLTDAIGFGYQQEGHQFYQLTFPSGNTTWCLDLTTTSKLGYPAWHQRAYFNNGQFSRHLANTGQFFAGYNVLGDFNNGNLYAYNMNTLTDNGQPRKWLRSWRATPQTEWQAKRVNWLEIQAQTGMGTVVPAPQLVLRQSFDGQEWSPERYETFSTTGQVNQRIRFNRLGASRRGLNSDRIFELSSSDAFNVALLSAYTE